MSSPDIRYEQNRLTVRIERVPLDQVLAAVTRETGLEINGEPLDQRDVSKRFDSVPLPEALRRLVGRQNFVLRYGPDGQPDRLDLLGVPQAPRKSPRRRGLDALRLLASHPAVALPAAAARALGGSPLPLHRVLRGLGHAEPVVRTEAARTLLGAIERDPTLLAALREVDANRLAQVVMQRAGAYATEVATTLYRTATDPGLKSRLAAVRMVVLRRVQSSQTA
jgi:hypothetical protein